MRKSILLLVIFVATCLLVPVLYVFGQMLFLESSETKNMRHLKSVFERSKNIDKYSIGRVHENQGWARVWLQTGQYIDFSLSDQNVAKEKWFVNQFGYYACEEGVFDVFTFALNALESPIQNLDGILENATEIINQVDNRKNEKIGNCTPIIIKDRQDPPEANEWKVWGRG